MCSDHDEKLIDKFNDWLVIHMDQIEWWLDELPDDLEEKLDYSIDSLLPLEEYLLSMNKRFGDSMTEDEEWACECATRYVGEIFYYEIDARWYVELDPEHPFYPHYVMKSMSDGGTLCCPILMIHTALQLRDGRYLYKEVSRICESERVDEPDESANEE